MSHASFLDELAQRARAKPAEILARDEIFWSRFAREYNRDERFLQLNYGYYHPAVKAVLEVEIAAVREINRRGSHFKLTESSTLLEAARTDLARVAGVDPEEIVITRNTSEALNIVIQGFPLETGDEVVASDLDYTGMNQAWEQREKEEGIRLRRVSLPLDPLDDDEIVQRFEAAITPRTKLLHVTHLIHVTGQILPAKKLCALARRRGLAVLVDAAHSFAQVDFSIRDFDCDFLGASLHKWLGAPLGTGLLFVRKDRVPCLRPLYADTLVARDDIRRLEHFGNRPDSAHAGLREAIRWHAALGTAAKQARLAYLHRSWADPLRALGPFKVLTPRAEGRYGAIGLLALHGVPAQALSDYLMKEHRIFTGVQTLSALSGVRITPGLPSSSEDIARVLAALKAAVKHFGVGEELKA